MVAGGDTAVQSNGTCPGYLHEMGRYASDDEFRSLIEPFALGGLDSGEPVVFAYDEHKMALLKEWLPESPEITYITDAGPYATPAKALGAWRDLVQRHLVGGAPRVRIAGNVPHEGYGTPYAGWDRYEAAVDRALGDLPVWAPCLYDLRLAPADVIDAATRLHHGFLDHDGQHRPNEAYAGLPPLADFRRPPPDPIEQGPPLLELIDPTPAGARAAVRAASAGVLSHEQIDELQLAATEAVTNALLHGRAPVTVRVWADRGTVIVTAHDRGPGPTDPLAGLVPDLHDRAESGRGLWILHNLDLDCALIADDRGFTVRLRAAVVSGT